jgi:hypothetical protein
MIYQPLQGFTDGPCGPHAPRVQSVQGRGVGSPSRSQGITWAVSTIHARARRCREGGLSFTDERVTVRDHVTKVATEGGGKEYSNTRKPRTRTMHAA